VFVQRVVVIFDSCCLLFVSADRSVSKSPYEGRINMYTWDGDIESNGAAAPHVFFWHGDVELTSTTILYLGSMHRPRLYEEEDEDEEDEDEDEDGDEDDEYADEAGRGGEL
jgi:hypothetical protein